MGGRLELSRVTFPVQLAADAPKHPLSHNFPVISDTGTHDESTPALAAAATSTLANIASNAREASEPFKEAHRRIVVEPGQGTRW